MLSVLIANLAFNTMVFANIEIATSEVQSANNKAILSIKARNSFDQDIQNARIWVFAMNDKGEVVGQKAQWLHDSETSEDANWLDTEGETEFKLTVDTKAKATQTKVTFSRIIMADGSLADVQKAVKPWKEPKE